jgi:hypothetical protein
MCSCWPTRRDRCVPIDRTKINTNASKYRSIRYDRAKELHEMLATDSAILMERAEAADTTDTDHQALPDELVHREALKAKPGEARSRLEAEARERVSNIIRSAMSLPRLHLRSPANVATEWTLVALAYNCRRTTRLTAA